MPLQTNKKEVIAIIPARGGSKGIPRKNIVDLCGKPLIAYTIQAALKSELITRVIVSTEDEEIAEISKEWGAEVPFLRPYELAGDKSNIGDSISYTIKKLRDCNYNPGAIIQLYPTHLFRNPKLLNFLINKMFEGYKHIRTVKKIKVGPRSLFVKDKKEGIKPLIPQDLEPGIVAKTYYRSYGLFYGNNLKCDFLKGFYLHELIDPISLIDIDTFDDLRLAKEIIIRKLYNFNKV